MPAVGSNERRKEGPEKLCGVAKYIDDYVFPGCLFGVTYRSAFPHGRIKKITLDPDFDWSSFVVADHRDIPGGNYVALMENDQPLLANDVVRHPMEPLLLIAHEKRDRAYEALQHVKVDFEPLPTAFTIEESLAKKALLRGEDNVFKKFLVSKGDVEAGLASAEVIVEGEYRVPAQEQAYIENNGMAAWFEADGTLVVTGSMQCPYYIHKAMKEIFHLPLEKIRIVQTTTGGGFGGKEEYPSMLAGHVALLALKAKRPVKMIYDRHEDMAATTKRHPAIVKHKTGLTRDGKLVAQDIEVVMDGGAYLTLSPVVLSRGTIHAAGPYECPNVRIRSSVVATNTPPNGAFRGFGAPQTLFAAELHWEKIAQQLGLDSLELRQKNLFKLGSITATGQHLKESVGAPEVLEKTVRLSQYAKKRKEYDRWNKNKKHPSWKGIGLAVVHHGGGFTGSGEVYLASKAGIAISREGEIRVLAASTEIGQGTNTMFAQVAADTLGLPFDWVGVETPDTAKVPNSGPTVASRTTMVVGGIVQRATCDFKAAAEAELGAFPKTSEGLRELGRKLCNGSEWRKFIVEYEKPKDVTWDDASYKGDAYAVYSYAACAVDLEVDKVTFEVKVHKLTTAQDIGKAIHPLLAEGQIIGGTVQGLGYALLENPVYKDGLMQNALLTNYIIPTALDVPPMEVAIVEKPYSKGPFGAKGVGELPMDVPGPAVAAALHHATGLWFAELPILPEKICQAFHDQAQR